MTVKLLHFSSPTCSICTTQVKVLEEIKSSTTITFEDLPITTHFDNALRFGVQSAPTLVYMMDERPVKVATGFQDRNKIERQLHEMGVI